MLKSLRPIVLVAACASAGLFAAPAQAGPLVSFTTTSTVPKCDDCSVQAQIGFSVKFGSSTFSSAWVNNNGSISFEQYLSAWTGGTFGNLRFSSGSSPSVLSPVSLIAPFFGDVDTRTLGTVSVGSGTYQGAQAFAVTWAEVGGYLVSTSYSYPGRITSEPGQNSFQLILTNRSDTGAGNFDIYFNYESIEWSASGASDGRYATQGMQSADGTVAYNVPGSGNVQQLGAATPAGKQPIVNPIALISGSNNGVPGQLYFQIRDGAVSTASAVSTVPEPGSGALLLAAAGAALVAGQSRRRAPKP